ncbi:MAG: transporter substrate-binding domain-containing protein [Tabrizicola sp.]|nr:transporter substrate-binding domain-containing protein [Tabrizicola sp.]
MLAAAALSSVLPALAQAQEACTTYTVQAGDTLGSIAQAAYATYDYQMIFNANRDKLATSFNNLPAGMQLILPCLDGRLTPDSELGAIISGEQEAQDANRDTSKAYLPPLRFVTGNGRFPFADESLTGGGALVRVATTALQRGGNDYKYTIAWVDDWRAQTQVLLPSGAMDIALPWLMPDCTKLDQLGAEAAERCTKFDMTVPVYELAFVLTTTADSAYVNARDYSDFAGARICQPKGWSAFPLEQVGLSEPFIVHVRLGTPDECGEALLEGEVDALAMPIEASNDIFVRLDAMDRVVINPVLVQILSLHFLASKDNPRGKEYIEMLNKGITEMRESGEWYDILATTLAEYQEQIQ